MFPVTRRVEVRGVRLGMKSHRIPAESADTYQEGGTAPDEQQSPFAGREDAGSRALPVPARGMRHRAALF